MLTAVLAQRWRFHLHTCNQIPFETETMLASESHLSVCEAYRDNDTIPQDASNNDDNKVHIASSSIQHKRVPRAKEVLKVKNICNFSSKTSKKCTTSSIKGSLST